MNENLEQLVSISGVQNILDVLSYCPLNLTCRQVNEHRRINIGTRSPNMLYLNKTI